MDNSTVLGTIAIAVSVLALLTSSGLAYLQMKLLRQANHIPALVALFSELRSATFHKRYNYIVGRLHSDHRPELGIFDLPEDVQEAVLDIAYYYQNIANLIRFGIIDEASTIEIVRERVVRVWAALAPYIYVERARAPHLLSIFEVMAMKASKAPGWPRSATET
jgi:hypothetical protein